MTYYLDTDMCIFALRGTYPSLKEWVQSFSPDHIKIPAIVKAELLLGIRKSSHLAHVKRILERFLDPFEVVSFCDECAYVYALVRFDLEKAGRIIGPNDLLIASTVLAHRGTLVTHNTDEFRRVTNLDLQDWTEPMHQQ